MGFRGPFPLWGLGGHKKSRCGGSGFANYILKILCNSARCGGSPHNQTHIANILVHFFVLVKAKLTSEKIKNQIKFGKSLKLYFKPTVYQTSEGIDFGFFFNFFLFNFQLYRKCPTFSNNALKTIAIQSIFIHLLQIEYRD